MEATNLKNGLGLISVNDLVLNLDKKKELAQIFMKSGLIPNQLNTPEKVLVCMFKAQELGLPPLEGLSGMAVINGKTTLQGNLILALINRSNKAKKIVVEEHENYCSVTMSRRDYDFEYSFTFSMDDAKKAGLLDKQIWRQYPKTMLKWRAVSGCARVVFSDVIGGLYTPEEIRTLNPVRENVEKRSKLPDLRDVFLCHAWDDRKDAAKELHDLLEAKGVTTWFSERDVPLGSSLLREIDKGLAKSRVGIVLVTPSFLKRVEGEGIADKELSALLARDLLVPIVHNTTFEDLREVSPLLGSRSGLSTIEESMADIAAKIAELVAS
jgi:hypothetical protein